MPENKRALLVFAKIPEPGRVKTRLTTLLSPEWAASLYESFLLDAVELYSELEVDVRLYFTVPSEGVPQKYALPYVRLFEQRGKGLGARMAAAFAETFVRGYEQVVIIGTDHPTLPLAFIQQAYTHLEDPYAITIGPSEDGGYYLLGMNEFYPQLFRGMTYSHDQVFNDTLTRASQLPAQLSVLPEWYDVDTPGSLEKLIQELDEAPMALVRTRERVRLLVEEYPALAG